MPLGDVLKKFRGGDAPEPDEKEDEGDDSPRMIKLTDGEKKAFGEEGDGKEVTCQVTGRYADGQLSVISVQGPSGGGDEDEMAAKVMGMMGGNAPMMRNQTMPSPS